MSGGILAKIHFEISQTVADGPVGSTLVKYLQISGKFSSNSGPWFIPGGTCILI